MAQVTRLFSFAVPRHPAVRAPALRDLLIHGSEDSPLSLPDDFSDAYNSVGNSTIWRGALPVHGKQVRGWLLGYRDGLAFQPNTWRGIWKHADREFIEPMRQIVRIEGTRASINNQIGPHAGGGDHAVEMMEGMEEGLDKLEPGELPEELYATFYSFRVHSMRHAKSVVLPFAELVEVAIDETEGKGLLARVFGEGPYVTMTFEKETGERMTYSVPASNVILAAASEDLRPRYADKSLSLNERRALSVLHGRARSEIAYFRRQVEDESFAPSARLAIVAQFTKATTAEFLVARRTMEAALEEERRRTGAHGAPVARAVLERLGQVASHFRALPFERHGLANPITELEQAAEGRAQG